ncbi:type II toxin-antitoxin system RelE/ParE family toxin [Lachnospiraceae bacterium 38-14]
MYKYIAFSLNSPQNAAGQLERLEKNILGLSKFPEKFRLYEKEPWRGRGLRVMAVDKYLVFYIPDKEEGIVTVIRVIYEGRDIERQLAAVK